MTFAKIGNGKVSEAYSKSRVRRIKGEIPNSWILGFGSGLDVDVTRDSVINQWGKQRESRMRSVLSPSMPKMEGDGSQITTIY